MRALPLVVALLLSTTAAAAQPKATAVQRKEAGNHYLKLRQYQSARDQYLAALKIDPSYADAHYNLGVVYFFRLHEYPRALYHFVNYARLQPDASDLAQVRALSAQALEKIEAAERKAYTDVLRTGTVSALETFITANPVGPYAVDAKKKIRLLQEYLKEQRRRDTAIVDAYQRALTKATPAAMAEFLQTYPDAHQAAEAERLRNVWAEQRAADKKAFLGAVEAGTTEALEAFLLERPQSAYAPEAQKQLQQLRAAAEALHSAAADRGWEAAVAADTVTAYRAFLDSYPDDPRAGEAGERVKIMETETRAAAERAEADRLWKAVDAENSAAVFRDFTLAYPTHPRAKEATRRADLLEASTAAAAAARQAGDLAWETAKDENTIVTYERFVTAYPEHDKVEIAWKRIAELKKATARAATPEKSDRAWQNAEKEGTVTAYKAFLSAHPQHPAAVKAERRLRDLQEEDNSSLSRSRRKALERYRRMLVEE